MQRVFFLSIILGHVNSCTSAMHGICQTECLNSIVYLKDLDHCNRSGYINVTIWFAMPPKFSIRQDSLSSPFLEANAESVLVYPKPPEDAKLKTSITFVVCFLLLFFVVAYCTTDCCPG